LPRLATAGFLGDPSSEALQGGRGTAFSLWNILLKARTSKARSKPHLKAIPRAHRHSQRTSRRSAFAPARTSSKPFVLRRPRNNGRRTPTTKASQLTKTPLTTLSPGRTHPCRRLATTTILGGRRFSSRHRRRRAKSLNLRQRRASLRKFRKENDHIKDRNTSSEIFLLYRLDDRIFHPGRQFCFSDTLPDRKPSAQQFFSVAGVWRLF